MDLFYINGQNMVQVETLAQFGLFFILFILGLEFNFEKVKNNFTISLAGYIIFHFKRSFNKVLSPCI
jgi:Kef-type K+ transport system membrane component KefB